MAKSTITWGYVAFMQRGNGAGGGCVYVSVCMCVCVSVCVVRVVEVAAETEKYSGEENGW